MIKSDAQLERARKRLFKLQAEAREIEATRKGRELRVLLQPLLNEIDEISRAIQEYVELRDLPLVSAVGGPLSAGSQIEDIGTVLAKLRVAAKVTQAELADRLGWKQSNVSRFESSNYSGQTVSRAAEFAAAFGVLLYVTPSLQEKGREEEPAPDPWSQFARLGGAEEERMPSDVSFIILHAEGEQLVAATAWQTDEVVPGALRRALLGVQTEEAATL